MRLARRVVLAGVDFLFGAAMVALALVATTEPAWGYVDPSVMTYTIQALAGVAVALSALLGVVWRRVRRVLLHALRIDENSGKVVEPTVRELDANDSTTPRKLSDAEMSAREARRLLDHPRPERLRPPARIFFAFLASLLLVFTIFVDAPLEIVASSSADLFFGVKDIWRPLAVFSLILVVVLTLVLSLLRGRAFNVGLALVVAIGVCAFLQAALLNQGLPAADGREIDWSNYTKITLGSAAMWLGIISLCVFFSLRKSLTFKGAASFASIVLLLTQAVSLGTTTAHAAPTNTDGGGELYLTMQGMLDVSDKNNVVVFVLDTFDTQYFESLLDDHPEVADDLTNFTFYPDSVGSMIPTRYGVPPLVTGENLIGPDDTELSPQLINTRVSEHNLLDDLGALDYSVGVYTADMNSYLGALSQKTINVHALGSIDVDGPDAVRALCTSGLYRVLPWALKPSFRLYTDEVNGAVTGDSQGLADTPYQSDDAAFYQLLTQHRLSVDDEGAGSYRFIHLAGAHYPYTLSAEATRLDEEGSLENQLLGSLKIVEEYARQLKELGVYDQTTIIVTADHGEWYLTPDDIDKVTSPILLVKPAGSNEGETALQASSTPTGHLDVPGTILASAGGDASKYGRAIFDDPLPDRTRYYWATSSDGTQDTFVRLWAIDGNALDWSSWHRVDRDIPVVSESDGQDRE